MKNKEKINIDIDVNTEKIQDMADIITDVNDTKPNITIRDNENVYVTINNFNETEKEYIKEDK